MFRPRLRSGGLSRVNTLRHTHFRYSTLTNSLGTIKAHVMQLMERPQYKDTSLLSVGCVRLRLLGGDVAEKGDLQCVAVGLSGETTAQEPEEHQTELTVQLPGVGFQVSPSPSSCFDCIPIEGGLALQKMKKREGGREGREAKKRDCMGCLSYGFAAYP